MTVGYAEGRRRRGRTGASGVLTFAPGVTIRRPSEIMDDAADDEVEAETFTVTLSGATNAELRTTTIRR